jgi:RNA polymerase sigma factor (sigma-70 family)
MTDAKRLIGSLGAALLGLRRRAAPAGGAEAPDCELLGRYLAGRDEAAFAALLRRHGPMVLGVCRRVLAHGPDAEDAFQAAFLLLARNAAAVRRRDALGGWLYTAAYRTALKVRAERNRRHDQEARAGARRPGGGADELTVRELRAALDEELDRLPERLRSVVVLCHVEGLTQAEAARRIGLSKSTLRRRLDRGLALLRARLTGRGLAPPAGLLAAALLHRAADAAPPAALAGTVLTAAQRIQAGQAVGAVASARVAALVREGVKSMAVPRWKVVLVVLTAVGLAAGAGLYARQTFGGKPPEADPAPPAAADAPPDAKEASRADGDGEPLPAGADARFGSTRLWLPGHVAALAYSHDGKTVASLGYERTSRTASVEVKGTAAVFALTTGYDRTVRLWGAADGRARGALSLFAAEEKPDGPLPSGHAFFHKPESSGASLTFSPGDKLLATTDLAPADERGAVVWDLATGKEKLRLAGGECKGIAALAFAPDGKRLAAAGRDGVVRLWDLGEGKEVGRFEGHEGVVSALAFSADGERLLTGGADGTVRLWRAETGKEVRQFDGHHGLVSAVAFSPDAKRAASSGADGAVRVWDVGTGEQVRSFHEAASELRFTSDGGALAGGGPGKAVHLWDLDSGKDLAPTDARPEDLLAVAFSPDGKAVAASGGGWIRLLGVADGKDLCPVPGHRGGVTALAWSPDGTVFATGGSDGRICLWDPASGRERRQFASHKSAVVTLTFSPDGRTLASAGDGVGDRAVSLWDVDAKKERRQLHGADLPGRMVAISFSPDGRLLLTRQHHGDPQVWDIAAGKWLKALGANGATSDGVALGFTPDGKAVTVVTPNHQVVRWEVDGWKETRRRLNPEKPPEKDYLMLSPGGDRVVGFFDYPGLWDVESLTQFRQLGDERTRPVYGELWQLGAVTFAAFSADGRMVAVPLRDMSKDDAASIVVWEAASGKERARVSVRTTTPPLFAFAPDGRRLAVSIGGAAPLVFDLARPDGKGPALKTELTAAELGRLWADLKTDDAATAFHAVYALRAAPASAAPFLAERLKPAAPPPAERLNQLVADLDSDDFPTREAAAKELGRLGLSAGPVLRKLLDGKPSLEARLRAEALLQRFDGEPRAPEALRDLRAVEVLEGLGRREAREVLEALAGLDRGYWLPREAQAALQRRRASGLDPTP